MRTLKLALVLSMLAIGTAHADEPAAATNGANDRRTQYDFEDDLVRGDYMRPEGMILQARRRTARDSLIRPRESFVAELLKSVEDI